MEISVRRAVPGDAPTLTTIARAAKAHWGYPAEWLAAWAPELTLTPEYVAAHPVFVAEASGEVVGVCALEDHGDRWGLEHAWVAPAWHGRGVGRTLVRRALGVAGALRPGRVTVVADPYAAGFYEQLGARRTGATPAPMPGAPARTLPLYELDTR